MTLYDAYILDMMAFSSAVALALLILALSFSPQVTGSCQAACSKAACHEHTVQSTHCQSPCSLRPSDPRRLESGRVCWWLQTPLPQAPQRHNQRLEQGSPDLCLCLCHVPGERQPLFGGAWLPAGHLKRGAQSNAVQHST